MTKIIKAAVLTSVIMAFSGTTAFADQVEGMWKRPASKGGTLEQIAPCGNSFCVTVRSGEFNGKLAGKFAKKNGQYVGTITDLSKDKTYTGTLVVQSANKLKMSGCVLKVICSKETWTRQ